MLIIRKAQMKVLEATQDISLARELQIFMEKNYEEVLTPLSSEQIRSRISEGISQARNVGLTHVRSIGSFVAMTFTVGPTFFKQKRIAAALALGAAAPYPDARFSLLALDVSEQDWEEARSMKATMKPEQEKSW